MRVPQSANSPGRTLVFGRISPATPCGFFPAESEHRPTYRFRL
jgi:hypothetical protein